LHRHEYLAAVRGQSARILAPPVGVSKTLLLICPTGAVRNCLSSPISENIPVSTLVETSLEPAPSCPERGALAIVTDAGRDAMDADVLLTNST
jgi:hypothetical protein